MNGFCLNTNPIDLVSGISRLPGRRAAAFAVLAVALAGCPKKPQPLTADYFHQGDDYEEYTVEEHSITEAPPVQKGDAAAPGRLWRFDLARGTTRNGAGFTVLSRQGPDRGLVVATEFDGTLILGKTEHKASGFGGVAVIGFDKDGKLLWSRKLDGDKYHYVKALEIAPDGDVVVGGVFGKNGLAVVRLAPDGTERWRLEPKSAPKWAEISNLAVDEAGNIVAVGIFQSRLSLPGVSQKLDAKGFYGFVARINGATGRVQWFSEMASPETKVAGVYLAENGDVMVAGDFRQKLRIGKKTLSGDRDFFVARFAPDGALRYAAPLKLGWSGRVLGVQPMAGERVALHVEGGRDKNALIGVAEADGKVLWQLDDTLPGSSLATDERARPDSIVYVMHRVNPSYGSTAVELREIDKDGREMGVTSMDAGPYVFATSGSLRRRKEGFLLSGSLRDRHWNNDGFYPFLLDVIRPGAALSLGDMVAIGGGTGARCTGKPMARKKIWGDLRVSVQGKLAELHACGADMQSVSARFVLSPDGTVTDVTVKGTTDQTQVECLQKELRTLRICPFAGGPHTQNLARLE